MEKKRKKKNKRITCGEINQFGRRERSISVEKRSLLWKIGLFAGAEESNGGRILIGPRIDGRPSLLDFVLTGERKSNGIDGEQSPRGWMRFSNSARPHPTPAPFHANKLELYLPVTRTLARTFPRNVAFE